MISIGSVFLVLLLVYQVYKGRTKKNIYKRLLITTITIEVVIERGYFLQLGTQQIAYRTICELLMAFLSLCYLITGHIKIRSSLTNRAILFLACVAIGLISLVILPSSATGGNFDVSWEQILTEGYSRQAIRFTSSMIMEIIQLLLFIIILVFAYIYLEPKDWLYILHKTARVFSAVIYLYIIEIISKYVLKSAAFNEISDFFLGKSVSTYSSLISRGFGYMLMGFTKEGSHFMFYLAVMFIVIFADYRISNRNKDKRIFRTICCIISLLFILSMSFTAVYMVACLALLIWGTRVERKGSSLIRFWIIIGVSFFGLLVLVYMLPTIAERLGMGSFLGRRLYSVIEEINTISSGQWLTSSTALEWSNRVRIGSTYETLKLLTNRPIFGLGFASVTAHSSLAMLISGLGIVGTTAYFRFILYINKKPICNYSRSIYTTCMIAYLLMNLFNSQSFRPFSEAWMILLLICFQVIATNKSESKITNFDLGF